MIRFFSDVKCGCSDKEQDLALYAYNFGNLHKKMPKMVFFPKNTSEIQSILKIARANKLPYSFRGSGHSLNDSCLSDSILILANTAGNIRKIDDEHFEVDAGFKWSELELCLNKTGRSFPVLTSELETTVGGTLSTGGFGEGSVKWGSQVHLVSSAELILPSGDKIQCSANQNPLFFRFSMAGLGQLGYISKVVLKTLPYEAKTYLGVYKFNTLHQAVTAIPQIIYQANPELLSCRMVKDYFELIIGFKYSYPASDLDRLVESLKGEQIHHNTEVDFTIRSLSKQRKTKWDKNHSYIFCDHIIPEENAALFAMFLQEELKSIKEINWRMLILAGQNNSSAFPLLPADPSVSGIHIGFGLYFAVPANNPVLTGTLRSISEKLLNMAITLKGRPYLTNTFYPEAGQLKKIFNEAVPALKHIKSDIDPDYLCNHNFFTEILI